MANVELDLHRASVEELIKLDPNDAKRKQIERLAHAVLPNNPQPFVQPEIKPLELWDLETGWRRHAAKLLTKFIFGWGY